MSQEYMQGFEISCVQLLCHNGAVSISHSPLLSINAFNHPAFFIMSTLFAPPSARTRLFLVSFLILFLELACIRWFGSSVVFLTFFTNIILMACFLGMSVGLLSARNGFDFSRWVVPILCMAIALAWLSLSFYNRQSNLNIDVGGQTSPQQIFFGTEYRAKDPSKITIPIELIAGIFFVLIALPFVGLGQIMGRAFNAIPNRVAAYTSDIAGSLCGIIVFGLMSYACLPALVWFALALGIYFLLMRNELFAKSSEATHAPLESAPTRGGSWPVLQIAAALGVLFYAAFPETSHGANVETYWSPYYKINYVPPPARAIFTNNIGHQFMHRVREGSPAYVLPHLLNRDSGGQPFRDVMIIGAGSGNDVQAARYFGAQHIDAVEIDPVIQMLGACDHPEHPYDDKRVVQFRNDDGRSFAKKTTRQYDYAVYALVDSLVLHSGYSSLRLESFLFTREALQDVKSKLKPGGVFAMYNFYRQGWVVARLVKLGQEVFGDKPVVISLPYKKQIRADEPGLNDYTVILCGDTRKIEAAFARKHFFWLNTAPIFNATANAYGDKPPTQLPTNPQPLMAFKSTWQRLGPASVDTASTTLLPTDNWPFLYLRDRTIPLLNVRGMVLIGVLSLLMLWLIGVRGWASAASSTSVSESRLSFKDFNWQMFFLGAGFMLLETKSVVHMALLFGSTWIVNSFVFAAILVMILLANLWVAKVKPKNLLPFYALLLATLLVGFVVPMNTFLSLPGALKVLASCAITFVPVFFAGVIFSSAFRESEKPDVDFGCNVAGIILGGLCEFLSLAVGFNGLLALAAILYALSLVLKPRTSKPASGF
jgi:hypothetical protein